MIDEMREWLAASTASCCSARSASRTPMRSRCAATAPAGLAFASIADLAAHAPRAPIGADLEFFARPEWPALRDGYGLDVREHGASSSRRSCIQAVVTGEVDVITAFSSDGRIAANDLVVLEDPRARFCRTTRSCWSPPSGRTIRCCVARSRRCSAPFRGAHARSELPRRSRRRQGDASCRRALARERRRRAKRMRSEQA